MSYFFRFPNFLFGTFKPDPLAGTDGKDIIFGFWGDDFIDARGGNDVIHAGFGNDTILPGAGSDKVFGGAGFDTVVLEGSVDEYSFGDVTRRSRHSFSITDQDGKTDRLYKVEAIRFESDNLTVFLDGRNNAVFARDDSVESGEDGAQFDTAALLANDRDFDGDALTLEGVSATSALGADASLDGGIVSYDPGSMFQYLAAGETVEDSFTYLVSDGRGGDAEATVTVTVTGENDAPGFISPATASVDENRTGVMTVAADDVDASDTVTYSIEGGADAALFQIDSATGALSFIAAPDYENPADSDGDNVYDVTIGASDATVTTTQDVSVTVNDVVEVVPRINEFHYDNVSGDAGEFIEVRVGAGADVSALSVELYNGSNGSLYNTVAVGAGTMTSDGAYDYYVLAIAGIQNGSPDGFALIDNGAVVEFLSYEGTFDAAGGTAAGMTSRDIGAEEPGDAPVGSSIQRSDDGLTWVYTAGENTSGSGNEFPYVLPETPVATQELGPISISRLFDSTAGEGGSEVVAHEDGVLYVTNGELGRIDAFDIETGSLIGSVDLTVLPGYDGVQSVAVKNGLIATAVATVDVVNGPDVTGRNGYVALIDAASLTVIDRVTVGNLPDMLTFTADGNHILVANEGEFNAESDLTEDPAGSVSVIDVTDLIDPQVTTLDFASLETLVEANGIRLAPGSTAALDLEPEYIAVAPDGARAFVALQEANAIAVLDLATGQFTGIFSAGTVDRSLFGNELDPKDDGEIGILPFDDLVGMRMPDAIASFEVGGMTYIITANEGDGRGDGDEPFGDEARVEDILAGDIPGLSIDASVDTAGLERLTVSTIDGDTDGDGDIDVLHAFGSRSFTIFDENGDVVFESGSEFERIIADLAPERFNNDDGEPIATEDDNRSDAKGPEPEAVTVGEIDGELYAFIGLERDSGVMIYNITDPASPHFVDYIAGYGGALGDNVAPETITFIAATESTSGVPQIAVAYEVSGTTVVYDLGEFIVGGPLINETFDYAEQGEAAGFTLTDSGGGTIGFFAEASSYDYFGIFDGDGDGGADFGADTAPGGFNAYGNADDNYLGGSDIDGGSPAISDPAYLTWSNMDISGLSELSLSADLATEISDSGLDFNDYVVFEISVDGGAWQKVLAFETADDSSYNQTTFLVDTDFDGVGDGAVLTSDFQTFMNTFAVSGSLLDLRLGIRVEAGYEDIGIDNIVLEEAVPTPTDFDLQITEMWPGQEGTDLTADWFEITNTGTEAWTVAEGSLFYDDDSSDPADAAVIEGITSIAPGESVIVVIGENADATAFQDVWNDDIDLSGVQVGWTDGKGLGQGGDGVTLFLGETAETAAVIDFETYPDAAAVSGQSWDVVHGEFSTVDGLIGVAATTETGGDSGSEPAVASPGVVPVDADAVTLISEIQGTGSASLLAGEYVLASAVVTYVLGNGFFMQEETDDYDTDSQTSEGIFVYTGGAYSVAVGDAVLLEGRVTEYNGLTEISNLVSLDVISSGNALPDHTDVTLPKASAGIFEAVEGMRVSLTSSTADPITVIENFNMDRYGEITISAGTQIQPTQIYDAQTQSAEIQALMEANSLNRLVIEDGVSGENPTEFPFAPNATAGDNGNGYIDAGDTFTGDGPTLRLGAEMDAPVEGVMTYQFGDYTMFVDGTLPVDETTNSGAREATPEDVGGSIQVASFNVLNYFSTIDVSGAGTGPDGTLDPRGADTSAELDRQTAKIVEAMTATGAEVFALQELENNTFDSSSAISTLVDALNAKAALLGSGAVYAFVDPTELGETGYVGTDAITTGIVYDTTKVGLVHSDYVAFEESSAADTYAIASALAGYGYTDIGDFQRNRPTVAATFEETATGETFTIVSNHFKSKGDSDLQDLADEVAADIDAGTASAVVIDLYNALLADPNYDQGDGQGFWNQVRTDAAAELVVWLEGGYADGLLADAGVSDPDYIVMGDLNAYAQEDPVQAVRDGGYVDLIDQFIGQDQAYSYVFDGQQGALDQALASSAMAGQVTGVTEWHINADEPDLLNYDESYNDSAFYSADVYASSDHDPVIVGLGLTSDFDTLAVA